MDDERAWLQDPRTQTRGRRQEAIFIALRLGSIQASDDTECRVSYDAAFNLARCLLGADQDDAKTPAALGNVEENILNRAPTLSGCVLVKLIQDDEDERIGCAQCLFLLKHPFEDRAHDESLATDI